MNTNKKIVLFLTALLPLVILKAQEPPEIEQIFEQYGKQQGSVLVELSTDVLGSHTKMTYYKSLITAYDPKIQNAFQQVINQFMVTGTKLIEAQKDGQIETGYYFLGKEGNNQEYEYILYKNKSRKITLIYARGKFPPQQLEKELDKLKDLFIYVNNKRIKLQ